MRRSSLLETERPPCALVRRHFHLIAAVTLAALAAAPDLAAQSTAQIRVHATQPGVSAPVAVRAIIRRSDGGVVPGEWGDSGWPSVSMQGKAMAPATIVEVPLGETRITVGKGPDYFPQTITTNLSTAGQLYTIRVNLQPVLDFHRKGWRAGEIHAHYLHGEGEVARSPAEVQAMCAAGGFHFTSLCQEHYGAGELSRSQMLGAWSPFANSECKIWLGAEEPKNGWGHHAALVTDPWQVRSAMPYHIGINTIHKQGGIVVPVHPQRTFPGRFFDHPGGRQWMLYPNHNYFKAYPLHALIGNVIDAWSGLSDEPSSLTILDPYFRLLNMGYRIPLVTDSDVSFDRINNGSKAPGLWMNYYHTAGAVSPGAIAGAIRKGRVMCTTGPLVLFRIDSAVSGDILAANGASRTVRIQASYAFNPWTLGDRRFNGSEECRIAQIDLIRNGTVIHTWTPNAPHASVELRINERTPGSHYMVRVLGNEDSWMAAYASPIYFGGSTARRPPVFKPLVQGRLYDAATGEPLIGTVSCVRNGRTEWTISTDSAGRFRAYTPIDAQLVARDRRGRQFTQDILKYEPAYEFCHNLNERFGGNMAASVDAFREIVQQMEWEFPMGHQMAGSYIRAPLSGDATMNDFAVLSAPPPTSGKSRAEIVMLILDKTQARAGDTIHYAALFRTPDGGAPSDELAVEFKGWNPNFPRMFTRHATLFHHDNQPGTLVNLGNGFYLRRGAATVPSWVANVTPTTGGIKVMAVAGGYGIGEDVNLLIPVGATKRELLVSTTWDGLPATWGELGAGPCNFHRTLSFQRRYSDYRTMSVRFNLNGQQIMVRPREDTAHVADADDAQFNDQFYYDGQCEPQHRNIPFRDPVRAQPPQVEFAGVKIHGTPSAGSVPPADEDNPAVNVQITGEGRVAPNLAARTLKIGATYALKATPARGSLFSHWSGDITSSDPVIRFTLDSDLTLQANFIPNPFVPMKGNYVGLFQETPPRFESSGVFALKLTERGIFSGRFLMGGARLAGRGQFNLEGVAPVALRGNGGMMNGELRLNFADDTGRELGGTLSGEGWSAELTGGRAAFNRANPAGDLAGRFTLLMPGGGHDSLTRPGGDGFGMLTVTAAGHLRFRGVLGEGTPAGQATPVLRDDSWPMYLRLYAGKGAMVGWIRFEGAPAATLRGAAAWFKTPLPRTRLYPGGFTMETELLGSRYAPGGARVLSFSNGSLVFRGGELDELRVPILLDERNRLLAPDPGGSRVVIRLTPASGLFGGSFLHPATNRKTTFRGALLPQQDFGGGVFPGFTQSGQIRIERAE